MNFSNFVFGAVEGGMRSGETAVPKGTEASQAENIPSGMGGTFPLLIMAVVFIAMMFFSGRKQKKIQQERQKMLNAIKEGDKVITSGGIIGEVAHVSDEIIELRVDKGTKIKFAKQNIKGLYIK